MKKWYIKSIILLVGIISLFTFKKVNAEGITLYKSGNVLESCSDCNTLVLPRTEYIDSVRIDYGSPVNFTSGSSVKGIANISFNGPPLIPLDTMNSCTFYIDINPFSASLSRNYYTQEGTRDYESGFHMETNFLPVNGSSFTSNAYFLCNITNESVGRAVNFVGVQFAIGVEGGDIPSSISNAANSINQNNDINSNNILNGISQGNQSLEDIANNTENLEDQFDELNEIGGEISDKMDTNNTLLGTISSKIQSFKDSVDGFLGGISQKIGSLINGQQSCVMYNKDNVTGMYTIDSSGVQQPLSSGSTLRGSDYISITDKSRIIVLQAGSTTTNGVIAFYDINKDFISSANSRGMSLDQEVPIPSHSYYVRININSNNNKPQYSICNNGSTSIFGIIKDFFTNNVLGLNDLDDTLGDFLDSLEGNEVLSDVHDFLLSPVNMLNSIRNSSDSTRCTSINTTMFNHSIVFPSGCFFWNRSDVSDFRNFWNILFGGSLIFTLGFQYFKVLHNAFDPTKDDLGGLNI